MQLRQTWEDTQESDRSIRILQTCVNFFRFSLSQPANVFYNPPLRPQHIVQLLNPIITKSRRRGEWQWQGHTSSPLFELVSDHRAWKSVACVRADVQDKLLGNRPSVFTDTTDARDNLTGSSLIRTHSSHRKDANASFQQICTHARFPGISETKLQMWKSTSHNAEKTYKDQSATDNQAHQPLSSNLPTTTSADTFIRPVNRFKLI